MFVFQVHNSASQRGFWVVFRYNCSNGGCLGGDSLANYPMDAGSKATGQHWKF